MFSICLLVIISIGFYFFHQKYPRTQKELIYFGCFITIYLLVWYMLQYQQVFIYKILKHIYDIHKKPLYSLNALESNYELMYDNKQSPTDYILQQQGSRCAQCNNFILMKDTDKYHLHYKRSLYNGGTPTLDNLEVICQTCKDFTRN